MEFMQQLKIGKQIFFINLLQTLLAHDFHYASAGILTVIIHKHFPLTTYFIILILNTSSKGE